MEEERNYEEDARRMGWVAEEEWKGASGAWRPAQEFVERGENIVPILKDRLSKVEADLAMTIKLNDNATKRADKAGYDRAMDEHKAKVKTLKEEQFAAVQEGNVKEFTKIEDKITDLKEPEKPTEVQVQQTNPVFDDWSEKNKWYGSDKEMTEYAEFVGQRLSKDMPGAPADEFYKAISDKVKTTYPDKFKNPNRSEPGAVGSGKNAPVKSGGNKKWVDLPDTAKSAYNRLKKQFEMKGRKLEKDAYVKTYFEE